MELGTFLANEDGSLSGSFKSALWNTTLTLRPNSNKKSERSPDYLVYTDNQTHVGWGWIKNKILTNGIPAFINLKLDDPLFPRPIFANLANGVLRWQRTMKRSAKAKEYSD